MYAEFDAEIINHFFANRPQYDGSTATDQKIEDWYSFKKFIKSDAKLTVNNKDNLLPDVLKTMTDGMGENIPRFNKRKVNIHNEKIPKGYHYSTFFCFHEPDIQKRKKIINNNCFHIGFEDDYFKRWCDLSFRGKKTIIPVSRGSEYSIKSWDELREFILPFKAIIISDNFILSDCDLLESNLFKLWKIFDSMNSSPYDLIILTSDRNNRGKAEKLDIESEYDRLSQFAIENNLKGKVNLIFKKIDLKEHDRNIFMSYLRINSGDTFNYFNSASDIIIEGTELVIHTYTDPEKEMASLIALERITKKIKTIISSGDLNKFRCSNNLAFND